MHRVHEALAVIARLARDDRGATAIEYAIIATCVSIAIVGTVGAIGEQLVSNFYDRVVEAFPR